MEALLGRFATFVRERMWGMRMDDQETRRAAMMAAYRAFSWAPKVEDVEQRRHELGNLLREHQEAYQRAFSRAQVDALVMLEAVSSSAAKSRPTLSTALSNLGFGRAQKAITMEPADRAAFDTLFDQLIPLES